MWLEDIQRKAVRRPGVWLSGIRVIVLAKYVQSPGFDSLALKKGRGDEGSRGEGVSKRW